MSGVSGHGEDGINASWKPREDFDQGSNVNIFTFPGGVEVDETALVRHQLQ